MPNVVVPIPIPIHADRHIRDFDSALALFAPLRREAVEVAAFAYLGVDRRLLGLRHRRAVSSVRIVLSLRDVARDVLSLDAKAVMMAHNHPSGDASPSAGDIAATRMIARTLRTLGVRLFDHIVLGRTEATSFRAMGLL